MIMNSVQQVTYDYIVSEYHRGRPEGFSDANSFDLYTIHMMREITQLDVSQETKEVGKILLTMLKSIIYKCIKIYE